MQNTKMNGREGGKREVKRKAGGRKKGKEGGRKKGGRKERKKGGRGQCCILQWTRYVTCSF